ncbi:MAG: 2-phosphosulfolactate phosphatase [Polyangiales bacterium]
MNERWLAPWELADVTGAVVTLDVIRAFSTAAYALAAGASEIFLVGTVEEALAFKEQHPGSLAMGEDGGRRPAGFDLSNSPAQASRADLQGRTLVQRTSAGTQGVLAARHATRQWCASLVCASATARAVQASGLGAPTYVITGYKRERPATAADRGGREDEAAASFIEHVRLGWPIDQQAIVRQVLDSEDARFTESLGAPHTDPDDLAFVTRIDAFDFCMPVELSERGLSVRAVKVPAGAPAPSAAATRGP